MTGQGAIIATGAIDYPAEYQAVTSEVITKIGLSKVMNITSTYDHRIIQGAESGLFLKKMSELLHGKEDFYEEIFRDLEIPMSPVKWIVDELKIRLPRKSEVLLTLRKLKNRQKRFSL